MKLCQAALKQPDQVTIERGLKMAEANTWDAIVAKLEKHINDALERKAALQDLDELRTNAKRLSVA